MSNDKDDLARLLGEMADGEHADTEDLSQEDHPDSIQAPPPTPATTPPPKPITPIAKTPPPPPKPVSAPPPTPPRPATTTRPPVKPAPPPRPTPIVKPPPSVQQPRPAPRPIIHSESPPIPPPNLPVPQPTQEVIADEEQPERYTGTDDDAVIVPALAPTDFIRKPRPAPAPRQHLVQKLYFKQTIIPILLTLGAICITIPLLGLLSSTNSPFKSLAEIYFLATFWPLGLAFLTFAMLTMLAVKKQLTRPAQPPSTSL